jgi:hypothetical protein
MSSHTTEHPTDHDASPPERLGARAALPASLLAALIGLCLWSRLIRLTTSLWKDEAFSILHYINTGPRGIFGGTYVPNDHVLYNFLSWVTTRVLGTSEAAYRVWSLLPGLAAVVILALWGWRKLGRWTTLAAVTLVTLSPLHLYLAPQARGYGLGFLAGMLLLAGATRIEQENGGKGIWLFAIAGLIGIWTLPIFVLPFLLQAATLFRLPDRRRKVARAVIGVGALSIAFYAPLIVGIIRASSQHYGARLPWYGFLSGPAQSVASVIRFVVPAPAAVTHLIALALFGLGAAHLIKRGHRGLCAVLVAPLLGTFVVLEIARIYVTPRFTSFLIFHSAVLAAFGLMEIARLVANRPALRRGLAAAAIVATGVGIFHFAQRSVSYADNPTENFKKVAQIVRATGIPDVVSDTYRPEGLWFYLGTSGFRIMPPTRLRALFCTTPTSLVFIDHRFDALPVDTRCLRQRGAVRTRVLQRLGGPIDIWVLRPDG